MPIPLSDFTIHKYFTKPNPIAEQIIIGSVLGDGSLRKRGNGNTMFNEVHCIKQKDYLLWKAGILDSFLNIKMLEYASMIYVTSSINIHLNKYYNLFYPNGKKVVTREILDKLEPLGLAVWYCDDGSFNGRSCSIST